jgi:MFS family permease
VGFASFTLVMPFLPLFIRQLGVSDVGEISLWTGVSLGVTPALNAVVSPFWGRLADRYGRKIMVARSLGTCALVMAGLGLVTRPWHVVALRAVLGLLTGYGGLTLTMAAESVPPQRVAAAIGTVQTAQRLGPAIGPILGGVLAGILGLRREFFVTAALYLVALSIILVFYDERAASARPEAGPAPGRIGFRDVLAFRHFALLMAVIFGMQFVDRSLGPILPLYLEQIGVGRGRVAILAGLLFSIAALAGAIGHNACGKLLARLPPRAVICRAAAAACVGCTLIAVSTGVWMLAGAAALVGVGVGAAMTAAYTVAAGAIPAGSHGAGFGLLTSASLTGLAVSPVVAGLLGAASIRSVFVVDAVLMSTLAFAVRRRMV